MNCQLLFYFSNINHVGWVVNNFSMIEWFQQKFEKRILLAAKIKHPRKLKGTHVWGNPYKAPIVLLREVYRFCCCCPAYIFSLDFPMLVQDLGKFQTHHMLLECITMSAFLSNFKLSKKFRTFDFRVSILSLQIYNFISVSQTQIGENVDKINNVESYIVTGNYCQLSVQYY